MRAGLLRQVVTVESLSTTENDDGTVTESWTSAGTRRALIAPLRGREFFEAAQLGADVTHKVTMRYMSGLTPRHRLTFGGRTLQIVSVLNIEERDRTMQVMCKEIV
jgi:SPP1 family predicted phage head-tail adaptor